MTRDDQVTQAITRLGVVLDSPLTPLRIAGYCEALADVPLQSLLWACREAERVCEFMPKPVRLRELAARAPRLRVQQPYNSRQIGEFTAQQCEVAKQRLADLVAGLGQEMTA